METAHKIKQSETHSSEDKVELNRPSEPNRPIYILGIGCYYHDSSAALIMDGKVIAAAEEERFSRIKHDNSFPQNAIRYCLREAGISVNELEMIAFYEKPLLKFERVLYQHIQSWPKSLKAFLSSIPSWLTEKLHVRDTIRKKLRFEGRIVFVEHHLSHGASAFFPSPYPKAAILTIDGVGEWATAAIGVGEQNRVTLTHEMRFPSSIGLLYSAITAYLGFKVNNSEYEVMGLSAYGNLNRKENDYYLRLKRIIDLKEDGSFLLDMDYFSYVSTDRMCSRKMHRLLDGRERKNGEPITKRHKDIAAAVQMITEDIVLKMLKHLKAETGLDNVVISGGVALNSVCNGKIIKNSGFKNVWIQPNPSDGGCSMGAALYAYHSLLGKSRKYILDSAALGPSFADVEIKGFLEAFNIRYIELKGITDVAKKAADLILDGKVIGWFQGRMEWGPRALGNRSIIADAFNQEMRNILNAKVKHREEFRPFAPAILDGYVHKVFDADEPISSPTKFMLMVYPVKKEWQEPMASITHVDGSGRLQAVGKEAHPYYRGMLEEIGKRKGMPVVINTSFNVSGEPIVCTPQDAYRCMMGTMIDCLIIGNYLIFREENLKDAWDSSK